MQSPKSFVKYIEVFSDKTWTTIKITALVSSSANAVLINCLAKYQGCLREQRHIVVSFLPVMVSTNLIECCPTVEDWSSVYWITGAQGIYVEGTRQLSSKMNAQQEKMS